jgi:hypothetical protein
MRLTLRTLLAYLDDVLDPADKEELARKIESSDFARDLVHQTRDSVRRLRLSAPQVIGTGMGMDPNSVAEYLDNALPPEQVGDYERICLESDVHLAETAACHHVLTMVLGEPAEVEPRSRQRMYMIPGEARERRRLRSEPAHSRRAPAAEAASPGARAGVPVRSQVTSTNAIEVPEYLRARAWWQSGAFITAVAAVLIIGTALFIVSDMMGWLGGPPDVAAVNIDASAPPTNEEAKPEVEVPQPERTPEEPNSTTPAAAIPESPPATTEPAPPQETAETVPPLAAPPQLAAPELGVTPPVETPASAPDATASTVAGEPSSQAADQAATAVETPPAETPPATVEADASPLPAAEAVATVDPPGEVSLPATITPDAKTLDLPPEVPPATEAAPAAAAGLAADASAELSPTDTGESGVDVEGEAVPPGPAELGTYLSGKTVLLRFDHAKGGWFRAEPRSAVVAGERLLSLPEFRPQITLASGVTLDMSGGTQVVMSAGDGEAGGSAPMIDVLYGRIVLTNTSNDASQVRIKTDENVGTATLERNATLAIEVERPYVPGNDPRTTPAPVMANMYALGGQVTWKDGSGEIVVDKPSRWTLGEGATAEEIADDALPEWIDREPVVHLSEQRYGAPAIERTLVSDRPVDIQLLELFKGRDRREVKSLVTRCGIHIGLFAPFIDALRDPEQRWPTWRSHIEALRSVMAQSPESGEMVFKALVDQRGRPAAADLYEMLCGYNAGQIGATPEEVKSGAISRLIDRLEEDSLDYRVLAVHNLWEITGKQLMPNPAANASLRKRSISRWRDQLESNELRQVKRDEED